VTWRNRDVGPICEGSVHVIPVPRWMTPEQAWEQITTDGRLEAEDPDCGWATIGCEGGPDCPCGRIELADSYQWRHNDRLVYDHQSTLAVESDLSDL